MGMKRWEIVELAGLFLAGFSTLFFAYDQEANGIVLALIGILAIISGFRFRQEMVRVQAAN
jgi:hypothetical protein